MAKVCFDVRRSSPTTTSLDFLTVTLFYDGREKMSGYVSVKPVWTLRGRIIAKKKKMVGALIDLIRSEKDVNKILADHRGVDESASEYVAKKLSTKK